MEDLKKSINAVLYERISSPLYGTFVLSWVASNWKAIFITIFISSKELPTNKLDYIIEQFYPCWFWSLLKLLIIPILSTFIFIVWMPRLVNKAFEINEENKTKR